MQMAGHLVALGLQTHSYGQTHSQGLWKGLRVDLLTSPAPMEQEGPDTSALCHVLPKLVLTRAGG